MLRHTMNRDINTSGSIIWCAQSRGYAGGEVMGFRTFQAWKIQNNHERFRCTQCRMVETSFFFFFFFLRFVVRDRVQVERR